MRQVRPVQPHHRAALRRRLGRRRRPGRATGRLGGHDPPRPALLEEQRLLARTHGGAVAHGVLYELPLRYRSARHREEKRASPRAAAARVAEGAAIGMTGGTTTTEVARALADRRRLTVVTNSLSIASELAVRPNLKLVVTGGVARPESYELVGPLAEGALATLNLDVVLVGVDGIAVDGRAHDPPRGRGAHQPRADRARPARVVVADSSKLGQVAFARICALGRRRRADHRQRRRRRPRSRPYAGPGVEVTLVYAAGRARVPVGQRVLERLEPFERRRVQVPERVPAAGVALDARAGSGADARRGPGAHARLGGIAGSPPGRACVRGRSAAPAGSTVAPVPFVHVPELPALRHDPNCMRGG